MLEAQTWTASELITRIKEDNKPIGFYVDWAEWAVMCKPSEALDFFKKFPPGKTFKVRIPTDTIYIFGWGDK